MDLYERVANLAKKQKISIPQLSEKLGFSSQYLYKWKTNIPKADNLQKVADYFNVSTDFLLGREIANRQNQTISQQMMEQMDTTGLNFQEIEDLEKEVERFLQFRLNEIKRKKNKSSH